MRETASESDKNTSGSGAAQFYNRSLPYTIDTIPVRVHSIYAYTIISESGGGGGGGG